MYSADYFIINLGMDKHTEGGYFKEVYKSSFNISDKGYAYRFDGRRPISSTIYFLLKSGQASKFHRLKSDEIWFYHYGSALIIHIIDNNGEYKNIKLGVNIENGEIPQVLITANVIFGAEPMESDSFSLVSCMVSPGFDYRDFILYKADELCLIYPQHSEIIKKLHHKNKTN